MRYLASYVLATLGGKSSPTADDIDRILSSVGVEKDQTKIDLIIKLLHGKKIDDLIAEGMMKLSSMPSGAIGTNASAAATAPSADSAESTAAESKKDDKAAKKEESESEDEDFGLGLFD